MLNVQLDGFFLFTVFCAGVKATLLVNGKAILRCANEQLTQSVLRLNENSRVEV